MGIISDLFKSQAQREAEAKQQAHIQRAANGQKITKSRKNYTPAMQLQDQKRVLKTSKGRKTKG